MKLPIDDFAVAANVRSDGPHRSMTEGRPTAVKGRLRMAIVIDKPDCCDAANGSKEPKAEVIVSNIQVLL